MTNRETLLALADRVEAMDGPDHQTMREAWFACNPNCEDSGRSYSGDWREDQRYSYGRFTRFLQADACESAAIMLVPEGWVIGVMSWWPCSQISTVHMDNKRGLKAMSGASSLPQALVAACLRAHAGEA